MGLSLFMSIERLSYLIRIETGEFASSSLYVLIATLEETYLATVTFFRSDLWQFTAEE